MVLICAKEQWDWRLGSWGAEVSAKQETIRSFVTPSGRERHGHVFFYFYIHKDVNSTIYRYMLQLSGDNQASEPVLCLERSGNALISNVSCKSCAKCGEIILSKWHLLFSLNSFQPGEVHKYSNETFKNVSTIHICTSSTTKTTVSRCEFEGENVSYENNMYIT